ncbi:hypothetical protein NESM_000533700 [Novymonas esmeraldas]|uniref:Uncharacterized protein n=1 Tax=Novymonas esmeraldas TaxID=1808958 RepID=A0AAW0ESH8_9TRYP
MPQLGVVPGERVEVAAGLPETENELDVQTSAPTAAAPRHMGTPKPRAVLFNTIRGLVYQVLTSSALDTSTTVACVFTVHRVHMTSDELLAQHISAATNCGLPFCVVASGITWRDVVATLTLSRWAGASAPPPTGLSWNVQVLGQDVDTGAWVPITPVLSSRLETRYFLCTDVEVLFCHYNTSTLYMQAVPLTAEAAGPDWRTPLQRSTAAGAAPPPAPMKAPRPPAHTCGVGHAAPLRRLGIEFSHIALSPPLPLRPLFTAEWSLTAFVAQQRRWAERCQELRQRTVGATPREALRLVREELRLCQGAVLHDTASPPPPQEKGAATWALSLLEHQCALLADDVYAAWAHGRGDHRRLLRRCHYQLSRAHELACKVIHVTDSVFEVAGRADKGGAIAPDFPCDWLALLLAMLRLRCLRHIALARACGVAPTAPCAVTDIVEEATQTAGWIVDALFSTCERGDVPGLPQEALSETLLTCALSLAELAAYLSTNTARRCSLMRAAVHVCRIRLLCTLRGRDHRWLPRCISDVVTRMQSKLDRIPQTPTAFSAFANLLRLLRASTECAAQFNAAAAAVHTAASRRPPPPLVGYTISCHANTAAVDDAFVRGNTIAREVRRAAASVECNTERSPTAPPPDSR